MTQPWWGKEAGPNPKVRLAPMPGSTISQPELLASSRQAVIAELRSRIAGFTTEWTNFRSGDAGAALVQLFGEQMEPALERLNLLPNKSLVEFLNITGARSIAATPAEAIVEFTIADGAPRSVLIPRGFQISAPPASGQGDPVIFETEFDLFGAPAKMDKVYVQEGGSFQEVDAKSTEPFRPFGDKPIPGRALLLGLAGDVAPTRFLSLGIGIAAVAGTPSPSSAGGIEPIPVAPSPLLRWEVLDGTSYEAAEIIRDETGGLYRSGIVELSLPRRWRPGRPEGLEDKVDANLRWLRLRIVYGQYAESPRFSFVKLNVTRVVAARTIFDEVLAPVADSQGRQMLLSQTPIIPGSLILEVDDGSLDSPIGLDLAPAADLTGDGQDASDASDTAPFGRRWEEVNDLLDSSSDDEVYVLDPETGIVTFGDGVNGAALPKGFRHVRAARYRVGGGAAGAVEADEITSMLSSTAFVSSVTNPLPASGGTDRESRQNAIRRGPQEFRARNRAVTVADYALMALRAPGAQIVRAHAVSGYHPSLPGSPIPGVVGVFVVPPDRNEGPPTTDENALRAVSKHLSKELGPLGVEVVVAAPRYHRIRAIAGVVIDPAVDASETIRRLLNELNTYLHPLTGGEDGQGWPFGGTLQYSVLVRRLLARTRGLLAVSTLNFEVDGVRTLGCADVVPQANALFWPEVHDVIVLESEESS